MLVTVWRFIKKSSFLLLLLGFSLHAQTEHTIKATLLPNKHTIEVQHEIVFYNQTNDTLNEIYLHDWMQAYAHKNTALAKRFSEEFSKALHLAKDEDRGFTNILTISDRNFKFLKWERTEKFDAVRVQLNFPVYPKKQFLLKLAYIVQLPSSEFTGYGHLPNGDYRLKYWHITPAVYNGSWQLMNNKDLNDLYLPKANYNITFTYPKNLKVITNFSHGKPDPIQNYEQLQIKDTNRLDCEILLQSQPSFTTYKTQNITIATDIEPKKLSEIEKGISIERIGNFIHKYLGEYPHEKLLVSDFEYDRHPLYGINQLPSFIRPFSENFQYELILLKTTLHKFLDNTLLVNPRTETWVINAIQNYLMIKYVDEFYPNQKLLGKLANVWGVRSYKLAQMNFNDQYPFLYMLMARKNIDQALDTPTDSLIKFNEKIANKYKAGLGLVYLDHYAGDSNINAAIKEFYNNYKLQTISATTFKKALENNTNKDISWFFADYVSSRKRIDFKLKRVVKTEDSVTVTIKNKKGTNVPISLFGVKDDSVVYKQWFHNILTDSTVNIPRNNAKRLVLNYDGVIPEFNQRDNWKSLGGFLSRNKKLKFQFFKDAEDPTRSQLFFVPIASYNFYDGFIAGLRLYNKTILDRPFVYDIRPAYATKENTLVGSGKINIRKYFTNSGSLYRMDTGLLGSSFHYAPGLRYSTFTPHISFWFRTPDFRSNERKYLMFRYANVFRDLSPDVETDPDYSIFNVRFNHFNNDIIKFYSWFADVQIAKEFSKVSLELDWRRLFQNDTQLNLRFFFGKFIHNNTNSDFFSYAVDRPTDYLFDYDYLGRSEESGLFSQQLIIAEGGFKSKLEPAFANDWMLTTNASVNLWKWIELYGDAGFVKNKGESAKFLYDSGIRLNLVTDYFELYFPLYSNNGWEIGRPNYDQRIRFIVTLDPKALLGLFTRKWF
jgi:hypothetical protein